MQYWKQSERRENHISRGESFLFFTTPEHKIVNTEMKKWRFINSEVISPTGVTAQSVAL